MPRWGLLLMNLGTPAAPGAPEVRRFLREFLMDPRVIDVPWVRRRFIVEVCILPFRPRASAEAYRKIWTDRGSPLLFHGVDLVEKVRRILGPEVQVELAMRYQEPSVAVALAAFRRGGTERIVLLPLFPQYSSAATGSAMEKVFREAARRWNVPSIQVVPPFHDHPLFLDAFAASARPEVESLKPDRVLMSFHGLPERQVLKSDESAGGHCLKSPTCCEAIGPANRNCYRAHCFATARGIAERLGLGEADYAVTFQSRLGRAPWIRPYTDEVVTEMASSGVRRLLVLSPAFVADCLETLEELGIRARQDFEARGGEELRLVPSLNSRDDWAQAVAQIARENSALGASG